MQNGPLLSAEAVHDTIDASEAITPVILTYNEAPNIERALKNLTWAKRVLVIDSFSNDTTTEICSRYPNTTVLSRVFDTFADQCNFALKQVTSQWVLSLDADYELSPALIREIFSLNLESETAGYKARFVYRIFGHSLRAALYPPRCVLYRRNQACYRNEGHGHRVDIDGMVEELSGIIYHDDRKSLSRWFTSQISYARLEADHLLAADRDGLRLADRIRLMGWPAPILAGFYTLLVKGSIFEGQAGLYYTMQRVLAELLLAIEIVDRRVRQVSKD